MNDWSDRPGVAKNPRYPKGVSATSLAALIWSIALARGAYTASIVDLCSVLMRFQSATQGWPSTDSGTSDMQVSVLTMAVCKSGLAYEGNIDGRVAPFAIPSTAAVSLPWICEQKTSCTPGYPHP